MANEQNLIPLNKRTKEERREIAKMGGVASGKARRDKRTSRERLLFIESIYRQKKGKDIISPFTGEPMSIGEEADTRQQIKAMNGDTRAWLAIKEITGEKTTNMKIEQKVEVSENIDKRLANVPDELLRQVAQHIKANDE